MNDYWNDPPDEPEPPECCDEIMEVTEQGGCRCSVCGKVIPPAKDIEPPPEVVNEEITWDDRMVNFGPKCPHGNEWFACDHCAHASDIAYDAWRERH